MNLATIAYIPPRRVKGSAAFNKNIRHWKTAYPLHLYSDDAYWKAGWTVGDPELAQSNHWYTISNCIFLSGLMMARKLGLDYFLYLEADSRVRGDNWDERIFKEHFDLGDTYRFSGTPVLWNIHASGQKNMERALDYAQAVRTITGRAPCIFSNVQPHDQVGITIYPNGSCAVYHVETLSKIFGGLTAENVLQSSKRMTAWDLVIGWNMWRMFGEQIFQTVGALNSVYSGCTDVFCSYEERRAMLLEGGKAAVHQIKSEDPMV